MVGGIVVQDFWVSYLVVISIITMTFGNMVALRQIEYQTSAGVLVDCTGWLYALMGIVALQATDQSFAVASVSFYMFMYIFTNLLAFGGLILFISDHW